MTSGGDWGPPFEFDTDVGADETGEGAGYEPPEEWADDPTQWELHTASGTYYRAPTLDELSNNGWAEATLLVIPPTSFVSGVVSGSSSATVAIPMAEYPGNEQVGLAFESVALSRVQTHSNLSFVVSQLDSMGNVIDATFTPNLHFYLPSGIDWDDYDETVVRLFASSRGGIELNGARRDDRTFRLHGPYDSSSGPYALEIAPPGAPSNPRYYLMRTGFAPPPVGLHERRPEGIGDVAPLVANASTSPGELTSEPAPKAMATFVGQCTDDLDNDEDDYADGCDFNCVVHPDFSGTDLDYTVQYEQTKNFALIGDGPFCMQNQLNWEVVLTDIGMVASQMLNWLEPPSGQPRVPPVRFAWGGCFDQFQSLEEAVACHQSYEFCEEPYEEGYVFGGVGQDFGPTSGNSSTGYTGRVWSAVNDRAAAADSPLGIHPVSMAVAIAHAEPIDLGMPTHPLSRSYYPTQTVATNQVRFYGAAVIVAPDGLDAQENTEAVDFAGRYVAHELGHTLGLEDDSALGGFMNASVGAVPIVDWDADSLVEIVANGVVVDQQTQEYAWTQYAPSKWAPRPSGFEHSYCIDDEECANGHPGLECIDGWCQP